jgi:hypothetical protein
MDLGMTLISPAQTAGGWGVVAKAAAQLAVAIVVRSILHPTRDERITVTEDGVHVEPETGSSQS